MALSMVDIALWDLKAKRAKLPLAKLLGTHRDAVQCYNTSGGFLSSPLPEVLANVEQLLERGIGGIKIKVGQPDPMIDLQRVQAVHKLIGGRAHLMVDANQQWDRVTAQRFGKLVEPLNLTWIEEPLDAYDAEGHAALAALLDTPVATGEMLTSVAEHWELIRQRSVDFIQPDAPRVGGITQMLKIMALADQARLRMAPHFAMEIHLHVASYAARAVGGALRMAGADVQRTADHQGRPHARIEPSRPGFFAERAGPLLDRWNARSSANAGDAVFSAPVHTWRNAHIGAPMASNLKGPGIFLAQFAGGAARFNS
jgi:L-alanine-DL-glutamate epimerase-like enolase superfamily enzyme